MVIEYKIKFENGGVTITQKVEPDGANVRVPRPVVSGRPLEGHSLGASFHGPPVSDAGGGFEDPPDPGGGGPGSGSRPLVILGPVVIYGSATSDRGGGFEDPPDPGGHRPKDRPPEIA